MTGESRETPEIACAYLIAGSDGAKIDAALQRLRRRAEAEGGELELFAPPPGSSAGPDPEALLAAIPALSLIAARRYLVAEGVERWSAKQAAPVAEGLAGLPPDLTVVLIAREQPPKLRVPKKLADAVTARPPGLAVSIARRTRSASAQALSRSQPGSSTKNSSPPTR